jgi:hypothetical protein
MSLLMPAPPAPPEAPYTRAQESQRRLEEHHRLQLRVRWHWDGMHQRSRVDGCPYCYPPGRWGDYMPGPTYGEILEGK